MNEISFMSANFVARQLGYRMTEGWTQGQEATNDYFMPLETFAERFNGLLREVQSVGFGAIDLWTAHLNWSWATDDHISIARELLAQCGLKVTSLAGGFGSTPEEFEMACQLAVALGTKILGGMAPLLVEDRKSLIAALREHDLRLAIENHAERTPEETLTKIGDGADGRIGTAVDTGWYGTQGYDAARAISELGDHLLHVHLKDVTAPGEHVTCRYGDGCVPIEGCIRMLKKLGYEGDISVEHEPEDHDPLEDCKANLLTLHKSLQR